MEDGDRLAGGPSARALRDSDGKTVASTKFLGTVDLDESVR